VAFIDRLPTAKEQVIHEQGLVSVLKQIHDDLDAAVFDAYGWPHDLDDEEILQRLVDLNHERAEEESRGLVRWLRPDFQNPTAGDAPAKQTELEIDDEEETPTTKKTKNSRQYREATLARNAPRGHQLVCWPQLVIVGLQLFIQERLAKTLKTAVLFESIDPAYHRG